MAAARSGKRDFVREFAVFTSGCTVRIQPVAFLVLECPPDIVICHTWHTTSQIHWVQEIMAQVFISKSHSIRSHNPAVRSDILPALLEGFSAQYVVPLALCSIMFPVGVFFGYGVFPNHANPLVEVYSDDSRSLHDLSRFASPTFGSPKQH
jgi:hypothetical protein